MTEKRVDMLIRLGQFLIGTVVVGIATLYINSQIQQREVEVKELEQLGKFVEQAIDENPAVRQRFAYYFATVSRSELARERWRAYKAIVDAEVREAEQNKEELKRQKATAEEEAKRKEEELQKARAMIVQLQQKAQGRADPQLDKKLDELKVAQAKQTEAEQHVANLQVQLQAARDQLQYTRRAPAVDVVASGWVYLGEYDAEAKSWGRRYFNIASDVPPQNLKGTSLQVLAVAVNVRSDMPNAFGQNASGVDVIKQGALVEVAEVRQWSSTGFTWARVQYRKTT